MFEACLPFGPCVTSNETFCPSFRVLNPLMLMAEKCANKSSLPSSGVMNPYPFASLNHFTVPVAIVLFSSYCQLQNAYPTDQRSTMLELQDHTRQTREAGFKAS